MTPRRLATLLAAPALALSLSACISVLPKTEPDQLYSFGHSVDAAAPAPSAAAAPDVGVLLAGVNFPRAAVGDGILTVNGTESAYIGKSRWVGPASILFREAVERSFDRSAKHARLVGRGEQSRTALILRIEVLDFAALYPNGAQSIPTVAVSLRARLSRTDGTLVDERRFDARRPATENRVGPIVQAFDQGVGDVLNGVTAWTDEAAAALPPEARGASKAVATTSATTTSTTKTTTTAPSAQ